MVLRPRVHRLSLSAIGTPSRGKRAHSSRRSSSAAACASARSSRIVRNALSAGLPALMRLSAARQISTAEVLPDRTASAMARALSIGSVTRVPRRTLKSPRSASASGAWDTASARSSEGRATSSRHAPGAASGCDVGGTPAVATCCTCSANARKFESCGVRRSFSCSVNSSLASRAIRSTSSRVKSAGMRAIVACAGG